MFEDKFPSDSRITLSVIIINLQVFQGKEDIQTTTYNVAYCAHFRNSMQCLKNKSRRRALFN